MKPPTALASLLLLFSHAVLSQDSLSHATLPDHPPASADSPATPVISPAVKRMLLPPNMSFMERELWGEDGIVREIGISGPLTPLERKHELDVRRTMLTAHQIGGFVSLGLMTTACYYGQRVIDGGDRHIRGDHQTFVTLSLAAYGTTAFLAVLSPPPLIRRDEISTTTIHKTLAWVHFAGMIATPILGSMIGRHVASRTAHIHEISAYITTATLAASMIVITF